MKVENSGVSAQSVTMAAKDVSDSSADNTPIEVEGGTEKTVYTTHEPIQITAILIR